MKKELLEVQNLEVVENLDKVDMLKVSLEAQNNPSFFEMDDFDKATISLFIAAEVAFVSLIGYRFSDGARKIEKELWLYGLPSLNAAGAGMLLGQIWNVV